MACAPSPAVWDTGGRAATRAWEGSLGDGVSPEQEGRVATGAWEGSPGDGVRTEPSCAVSRSTPLFTGQTEVSEGSSECQRVQTECQALRELGQRAPLLSLAPATRLLRESPGPPLTATPLNSKKCGSCALGLPERAACRLRLYIRVDPNQLPPGYLTTVPVKSPRLCPDGGLPGLTSKP